MKRRCKIGFPCGKSCISRTRKCWNNLPKQGGSKQFETFSQFVNRLVGIGNDNQSALKNEDSIESKEVKKPKELEKPKRLAPENFDIYQSLTQDMLIGDGASAMVYQVGDAVIKVGDIAPDEGNIMKHLNKNGFKNSPTFLGQTKHRLAMEKVSGVPIDQLNGNDGKLPKEIMQPVLDVIKGMHELNVAHKDLHGYNVLYDQKTKKVNIIDFGYSEFVNVKETPDTSLKASMLDDLLRLHYDYGKPGRFPKDLAIDGKKQLELAQKETEYKKMMAELYKFD